MRECEPCTAWISAEVITDGEYGRKGWSERRLLPGYGSMALVWILQKRKEPVWPGIPNLSKFGSSFAMTCAQHEQP